MRSAAARCARAIAGGTSPRCSSRSKPAASRAGRSTVARRPDGRGVRRAQAFAGLRADGVAGPATLAALARPPVSAPRCGGRSTRRSATATARAAPASTPAWTSRPRRRGGHRRRIRPRRFAGYTTAGGSRSPSTTATACAPATPTCRRTRSRWAPRSRPGRDRRGRRDRASPRPAPALRDHPPRCERGTRTLVRNQSFRH